MKYSLEQIFKLEPKLKELSQRAVRLKKTTKDRYSIWYGRTGLKAEMSLLVGHCAGREELSNSECYNTVYSHFINILNL